MHVKPVRYQSQRCLHFITFSCYHRMNLLDSVAARDTFEQQLERVRRWYGCFVTGYVVMPEHIHLLLSEPERGKLSLVIQMLKQMTSRKLKPPGQPRFWQVRYYDFPVWSEAKRVEKLRYIHRNPVKRGLVERPEDWKWSSFVHYATGTQGTVEIESQWTAAEARTTGSCTNSVESPPSRTERGKGGATPFWEPIKAGPAPFGSKPTDWDDKLCMRFVHLLEHGLIKRTGATEIETTRKGDLLSEAARVP